MSKDINWKEQKDGNLIQFKKIGESVSGKLIAVETNQGEFKNNRYNFTDIETKEVLWFFGSTVIDRLMQKIKIDALFKLEFTKELPPKKKGRHPTKIFKLYTA